MNPTNPSRLESSAAYLFVATVFLAPLAFWPSQYVSLDLVKSVVIAVGTLATAIVCAFLAKREGQALMPPRSVSWTSALIAVSLIVSALASIQISKSFFGQGFEIGTASFILVLFAASLVSFELSARRMERSFLIYAAIVGGYLILYAFQILRLVFGPGFASLSILTSATSTILGGWYGLAAYSAIVAVIALAAILYLPLSRSMKAVSWILFIVAASGIFIVDDIRVWGALALVFLGWAIYASIRRDGGSRLLRRIAWLPAFAFVIAAVFAVRGPAIASPSVQKLGLSYQELTLPWQMTLDVVSGAIKNYPLLGVGPNHFAQAFMAYKPAAINPTDAWSVEFTTGFGLIPTLVAEEGVIGAILWVVFLVFFGIAAVKALRRLHGGGPQAFLVVSSLAAASFSWVMMIVSVPPHAVVFYGFVLTGIFFGASVACGLLGPARTRSASSEGKPSAAMTAGMAVCVIIAVVWGLLYIKKAVALAYFGSGVEELTVSNDPAASAARFASAAGIDRSDIFLQAQAEAALSQASALAATVTSATSATSSQAAAAQISALVNRAMAYATSAIAYDPTNYYNYLSEARVAAAAGNLHMPNGYETAEAAYKQAIALDPQNPSIYLSLAQLQASENKLDDALQTVGAALTVKNNYLDGVFLLSQIEAAKGDLPSAITAAKVATQINPQNAQLFFQLGLLQYENKAYSDAASSLSSALKLQSDYANAQYFLGLADARLGSVPDAIAQFQKLSSTNPDNQEVAQILSSLKAGKSPFTDEQPPAAPDPAKRPALPIKQK